MKTLRNFKICRDNTSFPAARRALTSSRVNLAIDIDFTRCVNSRLQEHDLEHAYFFFLLSIHQFSKIFRIYLLDSAAVCADECQEGGANILWTLQSKET